MPASDLSSFKVAAAEVSSATKFNNLVQAVQDEFGDIDPDQIPGYPSDAAKFLRGDGTWAGAYSTFTPTWGSTGTPPGLGNGTISGRYLQIGKQVHFTIKLTIGSTSTFGTAAWKFTLPVTPLAAQNFPFLTRSIDSGVAQVYHHGGAADSGSGAIPSTFASPIAYYDGAVPFAWATGDTLEINGVYEAA